MGNEAAKVAAKRVEQEADYFKIMVEDGRVLGKPGTPDLSDEVLASLNSLFKLRRRGEGKTKSETAKELFPRFR